MKPHREKPQHVLMKMNGTELQSKTEAVSPARSPVLLAQPLPQASMGGENITAHSDSNSRLKRATGKTTKYAVSVC